MDMDLKRELRTKLDAIAPEYGMVDLTYPSFVRCYGYHMQPLSAADAVEVLEALLDAATGVRIEVEVEGARNGGEWFGGGRVWRAGGRWGEDDKDKKKEMDKANGIGGEGGGGGPNVNGQASEEDEIDAGDKQDGDWWVTRNFWNAWDALNE